MPKVLFITADQWRGDCLSVLGHVVPTPNLDALAAEGTLYRQHFANAVPCGPSRAGLHTGMYLMNHRSGRNGTPLEDRHDNWARALRRQGHNPVLFGYTDTSADPRGRPPDDPALRTYEGVLPGLTPVVPMGEDPLAWAAWLAARGQPTQEPASRLYTTKAPGTEYEDGGATPLPLAVPEEHHDTRFMVDEVVAWTAAVGDDWCVHLSLLRPHPPWVAPAPWHTLVAPADVPAWHRLPDREQEAASHPWLAWQLAQPHYAAPQDERRQRRLQASYYGLMGNVDAELGRLFAALKARGDWQDTLVVFTSDHGEQMGDHWLLGKTGWFDRSYHVPLIIRDPRAQADALRGQQVAAFTEHVDIAPTLLDWLGAPPMAQADGRSLLPLLADPAPPADWRQAAHWEYDFRDPVAARPEKALGLRADQACLAVHRGPRWKYVHFPALPPLLYDLQDDPFEMTNRASDPSCRVPLAEAAQALLGWRMEHAPKGLANQLLTADGPVEGRAG